MGYWIVLGPKCSVAKPHWAMRSRAGGRTIWLIIYWPRLRIEPLHQMMHYQVLESPWTGSAGFPQHSSVRPVMAPARPRCWCSQRTERCTSTSVLLTTMPMCSRTGDSGLNAVECCGRARALKVTFHAPVRNARFHEIFAHLMEALMKIEGQRMQLRIKHHAFHAKAAGDAHQRCQHGGTRTNAAPVPQHCHASDMAIGKQATCPDRHALRQRYDVPRVSVESVVFQLGRYGLFLDEYLFANCAENLVVGVPACGSNGNVDWDFHISGPAAAPWFTVYTVAPPLTSITAPLM